MPSRSHWGLTPRESIEAEAARRGRTEVIAGCVRLLGGDDGDPALVLALGGPGAVRLVSGENADVHRYWLRVWGARGLLWLWDDSATGALIAALGDQHWRVREMAAKVVARHLVGEAFPVVAGLRADPVERVRAAARRALALLTAAGA